MRKMSFVFLLVSLLFLGTVDFCSAQQAYGLSPKVRRWEIDVESGQLWSVGRDRGFRHHRFERTKDYRVPISVPKGRLLKTEERERIIDIIKDDFLVNDDTTGGCSQYFPAVAMAASGNFVICWHDKRNSLGGDIYAQRYNSSGVALGANFRVNDDVGTSTQYKPSISMDADGDFVVCWRDERNGKYDIYAQRYNSSGDALGANFRVNDDDGPGLGECYPSVAMDVDGDFIICWQDGRNGDGDIYAQRFHSDATTLGRNYLVNQRPDVPNPIQWDPSVALNNDQISFAWMDDRRSRGWDIYAKVVTWDWDKVDKPGDGNVLPNPSSPW